MKKRMRKSGILLVVFVAAIFVSSLFMNSGVDDQIIDLGDAEYHVRTAGILF